MMSFLLYPSPTCITALLLGHEDKTEIAGDCLPGLPGRSRGARTNIDCKISAGGAHGARTAVASLFGRMVITEIVVCCFA